MLILKNTSRPFHRIRFVERINTTSRWNPKIRKNEKAKNKIKMKIEKRGNRNGK